MFFAVDMTIDVVLATYYVLRPYIRQNSCIRGIRQLIKPIKLFLSDLSQ